MELEKSNHAFDKIFQPSDLQESDVTNQLESTTEDLHSPAINNPADTEDGEWVTGLRLVVIVAALTMTAFLMLLDTSIVSTVSVL
jgi:hypothetical protein